MSRLMQDADHRPRIPFPASGCVPSRAYARAGISRVARAGVSWSEHSTEPTQVFGRQSERRPRQALFERGDARVGGVLEHAE